MTTTAERVPVTGGNVNWRSIVTLPSAAADNTWARAITGAAEIVTGGLYEESSVLCVAPDMQILLLHCCAQILTQELAVL